MIKKFLEISVFVAFIAMMFNACKKDDDRASSNPLNNKTTAVFNTNVTYDTMTDQDGNIYKTVTIGTQTWMAENLRTTKYNDGTAILNVTSVTEWSNLSSGAYCNFNNTNNKDSIATFGRIYNWYAVNTGKLAPKGWHVPTDAEWTSLTTSLGGEITAGGKLKETGIAHWSSPNTGATNETGFTLLPGGGRNYDGAFIGNYGYWWSATEDGIYLAWYRSMSYDNSSVHRSFHIKRAGFSVRCLKD